LITIAETRPEQDQPKPLLAWAYNEKGGLLHDGGGEEEEKAEEAYLKAITVRY